MKSIRISEKIGMIKLESYIFNIFNEHSEYRMLRPSTVFLKDRRELIGCEIGVQTGKNAEKMLKYLDIKVLYLVDPYLQYDGCDDGKQLVHDTLKRQAHARLNRFGDSVVWVEEDSTDIETLNYIKEPLDFVYIDGNHNYEWVSKDISNWYDKVKVGGVISGHDINCPDVFRAVSEFTLQNGIKDVYVKRKDWWFVK